MNSPIVLHLLSSNLTTKSEIYGIHPGETLKDIQGVRYIMYMQISYDIRSSS